MTSHTTSESALPLSNVEAQWEKLAKDEQVQIYRQLEGLQKKDWKALTLDEKKAGALPLSLLPVKSRTALTLSLAGTYALLRS